jgi:hypothetical protein
MSLEPEIVEAGTLPPGECIFTGGRGPLIDTKRTIPLADPRGYISASYVEELARDLLGMVKFAEVQALVDRVEELEAEVESYAPLKKIVQDITEVAA